MPSVTYSSTGDIRAAATLAANTTTSGYAVDFSSSKLGGWIGVAGTGGGTVAATNGCKITVYAAMDSTPNYEVSPSYAITLPIVVSTAFGRAILVPCGKYSVVLQNLDTTNALSSVSITSNPIA